MTARKFDPAHDLSAPDLDLEALPSAEEIRIATGNGRRYVTTVTYEVTVAVPDTGPLTLGILRALLAHPDITVLPDTYTASLGRPPGAGIGHALRVTSQGGAHVTDDTFIEELDFTVRTYNCLKREAIATVGHLRQWSEGRLREVRNFNERSVQEVVAVLGRSGLALSPDPEDAAILGYESPS